jgi:glucose-6-phosphate 1-dehydrogenase
MTAGSNAPDVRRIGEPVGRETFTADDATIIIFGASGDLTARKLLPALFTLFDEGYLSERAPIIGVARRDKTDESFREEMAESVREHSRRPFSAEKWAAFEKRLFYRRLDLSHPDDYSGLKTAIEKIEKQAGVREKRLAYLAIAPELFIPTVESIVHAGLVPSDEQGGWLRVVVEKPFGRDLESANEMDRQLSRLLSEDQIYRIDHYLGKETVQNILLFRFGNSIFEPLFNRNHVDHVQITVAESQGIEHGRGGYYEQAGALRDVLQNHVLQLLCLIAMEPPALFRAKDIRDEKLKVLKTLSPGDPHAVGNWVVAGQYTEGEMGGQPVPGYREEDRVAKNSHRETYVAMQVGVDNWRWAGVPFYLRTGKRMPERVSEIAIQFTLPPLHLFTTIECEGDFCERVETRPNTLIFRIQPREGISQTFAVKRPGMQYQIQPVTMDFAYESAFQHGLPEAYERLLLDVLRGDSTLFTRSDELEAAWEFVMPALTHIEQDGFQPEPYRAGTWGPTAADRLLSQNGRRWRVPRVEKNSKNGG